jgi:FkbM family methyltransferase
MQQKEKSFQYHFKECNDTVKKYKKFLENADIVDIGSNIGFFSEAVIKNIKYKSLHLFEPCKEYYDHSVTKLSPYRNMHFNNCGLSDITEKLSLYKSSGTNIGWNTFLEKDPNQNDKFLDKMIKEECSLTRFDDYVIDNVDFMKIDVEGFEHKVLKGAINLITKFKPYILVEVGWGTAHPEWSQCQIMYDILFDMGYKVVKFTDKTEDILFIPDVKRDYSVKMPSRKSNRTAKKRRLA